MMTWFRRVWHLLNRPRHERELVREMNEHRESMHDPAKFGDTHRLLERSRDAWGWNWLDDAVQDLAVGSRTLAKSPSFAITATLILTFGIGLNVTLYQMIQVGLLRPPAVKDADSWVRFLRSAPRSTTSTVPYPLAQFVKDHNSVLAAVTVETGATSVALRRVPLDRRDAAALQQSAHKMKGSVGNFTTDGAFGAAQQSHSLGGEQGNSAGTAASAEVEQRRHDGLGTELDAGIGDRRGAGAEPVLGTLLLGDLDEADFAQRRWTQVSVFEALGQPLRGRPQGDAAIVLGFLMGVQHGVEAVAKLGPPGAAAVSGIEAEVNGENSQRRAPFAQLARSLQGRLGHRLASLSRVPPATPRRSTEKPG